MLSGGLGADLFIFGPGKDVVADWGVGGDGDILALLLPTGGFGSPTGVKIAQSGADTVLTYTNPDMPGAEPWMLTLKNVLATTITYDDFRFS
jgi:hypothetical protein